MKQILIFLMIISGGIAQEYKQIRPEIKHIPIEKAVVPDIKYKRSPVIIVACEKSYTAYSSFSLYGSPATYTMYILRHNVLQDKLQCDYRGQDPNDEQWTDVTKYKPIPTGTSCITVADFKFECRM